MSVPSTLSASREPLLARPFSAAGRGVTAVVGGLGALTCFTSAVWAALFFSRKSKGTLVPCLYRIGVQSLPVVAVTGMFIGMVLAVEAFEQFRMMHLESRLGAVVNVSLVKELGPAFTGVMLAGRVGCSMAAELGTMRVTEQIDAMRVLGADPVAHLVVPRFLACVLLIPLLTGIADVCGIFGGWALSTQILGVRSFDYWYYTQQTVLAYDVIGGLGKSVFFGAAIGIIACHRGLNCGPGADGVGRAATSAFVQSFVAILVIDFVLGVFLSHLYHALFSHNPGLL